MEQLKGLLREIIELDSVVGEEINVHELLNVPDDINEYTGKESKEEILKRIKLKKSYYKEIDKESFIYFLDDVTGKKAEDFTFNLKESFQFELAHFLNMNKVLFKLMVFSTTGKKEDQIFVWGTYYTFGPDPRQYYLFKIEEAIFDSKLTIKEQVLPEKNVLANTMFKIAVPAISQYATEWI